MITPGVAASLTPRELKGRSPQVPHPPRAHRSWFQLPELHVPHLHVPRLHLPHRQA